MTCLIWGMGSYFRQAVYVIKYHEKLCDFDVIGVTSNTTVYEELEGYKYIEKERIVNENIDFIIVATPENRFPEILNEAVSLGYRKEQIMPYWVFNVMGFDIKKYLELRAMPPSIVSINCWGGITYHSLGMEFLSPTINLSFDEQDYLRFVSRISYYMSQELKFYNMQKNEKTGVDFPVIYCDDVRIDFDHYKSFEDAKRLWDIRKRRIDENNIFLMMYTENRETAEVFSKLPYEKKICFVPFESDLSGLSYVPFRYTREMSQYPFYEIVNGMARGQYPYYDVIELLHNGRIKPIVKLDK